MYLRAFTSMGQSTGTYPVFSMTIAEYERRRAEVEREAIRLRMSTAEWEPLLPVPRGNYIHDPTTGKWYRAGTITQIAWEILPPVVQQAGQFVNSTPLSEAEAYARIARVEASRQPGYGTPETLPERLDWTTGLTPEERAAIDDFYDGRPTSAPPAYVPPAEFESIPEGIVQQRPGWMGEEEFYGWVDIMGGRADLASAVAASFPTRHDAEVWTGSTVGNIAAWIARAKQFMKYPQPIGPPAAAPPGGGPPGSSGNVAPPGTTPPGHRYPIIQYAPHNGTALLRGRGWTPAEIGFWLTQAFGGHLDLTEAFLLSFSGREDLAAWVSGKEPADVYARADAALAARGGTAPPPGTYIPPAGEESGIPLGMIALLGAGLFYLSRR